ncbi:MAG TPA: hypothetical protein VH372_18700 [Actinospica sp.]|jgi:hypothetical protein|nr:hypothetical protein [Actinospica sp.]
MRWGTKSPKSRHRRGGPGRVVRDSTAAVSAAAQEEARKGTAAADPVIGVTPEGQTLAGAVVDGEFVAATDRSAPRDRGGQDADDPVAAGELLGENERMKHVWWSRRSAG